MTKKAKEIVSPRIEVPATYWNDCKRLDKMLVDIGMWQTGGSMDGIVLGLKAPARTIYIPMASLRIIVDSVDAERKRRIDEVRVGSTVKVGGKTYRIVKSNCECKSLTDGKVCAFFRNVTTEYGASCSHPASTSACTERDPWIVFMEVKKPKKGSKRHVR